MLQPRPKLPTLTIKANTTNGIQAGTYATTVRAEWLDENGALQSKEANFNIIVKAKATGIKITEISGDKTDLIKESDKDAATATATLKNATAGTLTVKAEIESDRPLTDEQKQSLKYTVKNTAGSSAGLSPEVGTATDVEGGKITITIPVNLTAEGTFDVVFSVNTTDELENNSPAVTKKLTVTVGAAS